VPSPAIFRNDKLNLHLNLRSELPSHLEIDLPYSKSIWIRSLFINALQGVHSNFDWQGQSEDIILFEDAVKNQRDQYDFDNAGTPFRFFLAFKALKNEACVLDGNSRMRERPMGALLKALRDLGAEIICLEEEGFAPIQLKGGALNGNRIQMDSSESSQPLSAIMQIAPYLPNGLAIEVSGKRVSWSYVEQTANLMTAAGAQVSIEGNEIHIAPKAYDKVLNAPERDWSAASYWFEFLALRESGSIFFPQLHTKGLQGDERLMEIYEKLGIETVVSQAGILIKKVPHLEEEAPLHFDLSTSPDLGPALVCTFAALRKEVSFSGIGHLRLKESDRIQALAEQIHLFGCSLDDNGMDEVTLHTSNPFEIENFVFDSFGDHRIAMAVAASIPRLPQMKVMNAEVVKKSYPTFWEHIHDLAQIREW
jgi:3-phosphoshikimate 1-carboxyvinyltransferase